jgi:hypothetical protein
VPHERLVSVDQPPGVQVDPFQHMPDPQSHTGVIWLCPGGQVHAPGAQVWGNADALVQHDCIVTVPPEAVHASARPPSEEESAPPPSSPGPSVGESIVLGESSGESAPPLSIAAAVHPEPFQHPPEGQLQTCTVWLDDGAQPHAPTRHVSGKSLALMQHVSVDTVPPAATQAAARPPPSLWEGASEPESAPPPPPLLLDEQAIARKRNAGNDVCIVLDMSASFVECKAAARARLVANEKRDNRAKGYGDREQLVNQACPGRQLASFSVR